MAVYSIEDLGARIDNYIKLNGVGAITGTILNGILKDMIDSLLALASQAETLEVTTGDFTADGDYYTVDITHEKNTATPSVVCFDANGIVSPSDYQVLDPTTGGFTLRSSVNTITIIKIWN